MHSKIYELLEKSKWTTFWKWREQLRKCQPDAIWWKYINIVPQKKAKKIWPEERAIIYQPSIVADCGMYTTLSSRMEISWLKALQQIPSSTMIPENLTRYKQTSKGFYIISKSLRDFIFPHFTSEPLIENKQFTATVMQ